MAWDTFAGFFTEAAFDPDSGCAVLQWSTGRG
jgi:hypothetical protein